MVEQSNLFHLFLCLEGGMKEAPLPCLHAIFSLSAASPAVHTTGSTMRQT